MNQSINIAGRRISPDAPPFVIAEISANHNGSIDSALRLVEEAKRAGADAVKLQTYRPDTITLDSKAPEFCIDDGLWKGRTLYDLYEEAHTPWDWHPTLFEHAKRQGIIAFSSPFDNTAVDLLDELDVPAYKIASFEVIDLPLVRYIASKGKPIVMSTGMADETEIAEAVDAVRSEGCKELLLLHCVSGYPAPSEDYNLATIPDLAQRFDVPVGLSDHTLGTATAVASMALGACAVEKHFTLDRSGGGPDDSFSLEPDELGSLVEQTRVAWQALGKVDYGHKSSEKGNVKFRRSLYFVKALKAGEAVPPDAVRSVRPGYGAAPKLLDQVIGARLKCNVAANTPVRMADLNTDMRT